MKLPQSARSVATATATTAAREIDRPMAIDTRHGRFRGSASDCSDPLFFPSVPSLVNHLSYHNTDRLGDGLTSSNINRYQLQLGMKEAPTEQERKGELEGPTDESRK